jgi:hypothetical protein
MRRPRTEVRPVTVDAAEALQESDAVFRDRFGLDVAEGYLAFPEALPAILEALRSGTPPEWSRSATAWPRTTAGAGTRPRRCGRGMDLAARKGVLVVRAHTLPAESASTAVLAKLGFARVAEVDDEESGPVWRWERPAVTR